MTKIPKSDSGFELTIDQAVRTMHLFGAFGDVAFSEVKGMDVGSLQFKPAVGVFQKSRDLLGDEIVGPITKRELCLPTCGTPAERTSNLLNSAWVGGCGDTIDYTQITWNFNPRGVRGISETTAVDLAHLAMRRWSESSGIDFKWVDDVDDANIKATMSQLGRSILGLAQLPYQTSCSAQLFLRMQESAQWSDGDDGSFVEVYGHEAGHNGGHQHEDRIASIMTSRALGVHTAPTGYDIDQSRRRYGIDKVGAGPPQPPLPGGALAYIIGEGFDAQGNNLGPVTTQFSYSGSKPPEL